MPEKKKKRQKNITELTSQRLGIARKKVNRMSKKQHKMRNHFIAKLKYDFDNVMSKGFRSKVFILFVITVVIVIIAALLVCLWAGEDDKGFINNIWTTLMHTIDSGTITADSGTMGYMVIMTIVTLCGLLITSVLIGIINNGLEGKMDELRKGKSTVLERNHTIILGFPKEIYGMLKELNDSNPHRKKKVVVIMSDLYEKTEMEDYIERYAPDLDHLHIICRKGNISKLEDIRICAPQDCNSIIIRARSDYLTIKSILAVTSILSTTRQTHTKKKNNTAFITTVIKDEANLEAARNAAIDSNGNSRAEILRYDHIISRIIAHTSRHAGLSKVFIDLFNFYGDEIYFKKCTTPKRKLFRKPEPSLVGMTISQASMHFPEATLLGIDKKNKTDEQQEAEIDITNTDNKPQASEKEDNGDKKSGIILNPKWDEIIKEGDDLILLAEDETKLKISKPAKALHNANVNGIKDKLTAPKRKTGNLLILGYSHRLKRILDVQDRYFGAGTIVTLVLPNDKEYVDAATELCSDYKNLKVKISNENIYNTDVTKMLPAEYRPDTVVILSDSYKDAEEEDSKTLVLLLNIRKYAESLKKEGKPTINIICEMQRTENEELASLATNVNDFIVGGKMISLMLTQISQERRRRSIFKELLEDNGAEFYIRPASDYVELNKEIDLMSLSDTIQKKRGETFVGFRYRKGNTIKISLNLPKLENNSTLKNYRLITDFSEIKDDEKPYKTEFTEDDRFVILANNPYSDN